MTKSAGILAYRGSGAGLEVFLVHPGGPFYARKDAGAWTIPKGEFEDDEEPLAAAQREFLEETGIPVSGKFLALSPFRQKSGKTIYAWAIEADFDAGLVSSNHFEMEWPPKSGKFKSFPEVDRGAWYSMAEAMVKILPAQQPVLLELPGLLKEISS